MNGPGDGRPSPIARSSAGPAATRALLFFGLWIVLDQSAKPADVAVGLLTSVGAAWVSLRLLPPASGRVRFVALVALLPRFLWQSLVAGVDVARRVFHLRVPLSPGFVDYPVRLPRGSARNAFELISSLLPGSVPSDESETAIEYHCLDVGQPVVEQLAAEEKAYGRAFVPGRRHG
jgi:multicomponent Na+:H+ antiporter subunit E